MKCVERVDIECVFLCVFCRYEFALAKTDPSRTLNNSTQIHIFSSSIGHLITIFASSLFLKERLAFNYNSPTHKKYFS